MSNQYLKEAAKYLVCLRRGEIKQRSKDDHNLLIFTPTRQSCGNGQESAESVALVMEY